MTLSRRELLQASLIAGLWRPAELAAQSLVTADVIAETTMGRIRGVAVDGVHIFKGVPYGGPTEGGAGPLHAAGRACGVDRRPRRHEGGPPGY